MQSLSEAFKTRYIKLIEAVTLLWQVLGLSIARLVGFEVVCPRILSHIPPVSLLPCKQFQRSH